MRESFVEIVDKPVENRSESGIPTLDQCLRRSIGYWDVAAVIALQHDGRRIFAGSIRST